MKQLRYLLRTCISFGYKLRKSIVYTLCSKHTNRNRLLVGLTPAISSWHWCHRSPITSHNPVRRVGNAINRAFALCASAFIAIKQIAEKSPNFADAFHDQYSRRSGLISCKIVVAISSIDLVVVESQRMPSRRIMASASCISLRQFAKLE